MWYNSSSIIYSLVPNSLMISPETLVASCSPAHKCQLEFFKAQMPFLPPPIMVSLIFKAGSDSYNGTSQTTGKCSWTSEGHRIISGHRTVSLANLIHTQGLCSSETTLVKETGLPLPPLHTAVPDKPKELLSIAKETSFISNTWLIFSLYWRKCYLNSNWR